MNKNNLKNKVRASKLIVDVDNVGDLPKRFRTTSTPINSRKEGNPDLFGLVELKSSGSGMFSETGLLKVKEVVGDHSITIVDTRKESHGFVNGKAISWYGENNYANIDLSPSEVLELERNNLDKLKESESIIFEEAGKKSIKMNAPITNPKEVLSEKELAEKVGMNYIRFFVTDHNRITDNDVDRFIEFYKEIPEGEWLHFHCRGGVGRTTTFMIMYDMLRNVPQVSYSDILTRQHLIGGRDMTRLAEGTYKHKPAVERLKFLEKFYNYCIDNCDKEYQISWTEWLSKN